MLRLLLVLTALSGLAAPATAQFGTGGLERKKVEFDLYHRVEGREVRVAIRVALQRKWHLYHHELGGADAVATPTEITLEADGVSFEAPRFPEPERYQQDPAFGDDAWVWQHSGRFAIYARGELAEGASAEGLEVTGTITGQVCEDDGVCIQVDESLRSQGTGPDAVFADYDARMVAADGADNGVEGVNEGTVDASGGAPSKGDRDADCSADDTGAAGGAANAGSTGGTDAPGGSGGAGLLQFILLAIGGGLFALVMPCTYPMIPITISFFTKQADARGGKVLPLALAYGAGIITIFIGIGVLLGPPIMVFATHWLTNLVIGLAFLFFALVLFGAVNLQPPAFLMSAAGKASTKGGYLGVFLMGATLVVTSFTCTAPFVGTLLAAGATSGSEPDYLRIALGMGVFGLTMAIPFVFLSLVPGRVRSMPQGGEWMNTIKVTLGFVEVAAALKFFSTTDLMLGWGVLSRELFLVMWAAIFALASAYLFGWIPIKGHKVEELGPARAVFAMLFALFALYNWHGSSGHRMDNIMTALAPAYSSRIEPAGGGGSSGGAAQQGRTIVTDDYQAARERAIAAGKPLFLNFTGWS